MGQGSHNQQSFSSKRMTKSVFKRAFLHFLTIFITWMLLCGFSFSDTKKLHLEIKEEIKKELEKIIEKTPSAKLRNRWRKERDAANLVLEKALLLSAAKFCPDKWDEAVMLFQKAKKYAARRAYRKAIYLARETRKAGEKAVECSQGFLDSKTKKLLKKYKEFRSRIDEIRALVPPGAEELLVLSNDLSLEVEDFKLAIDLRQFKDAEKMAPALQKKLSELAEKVNRYRQEHRDEEDLVDENMDDASQ